MSRVNKVTKQTNNRFLNLYELEVTFRDGRTAPYYVASRREQADRIKAVTGDNHPDGVILYGVYGEKKDRIVLIRQFRFPINGYVYEFPAGLVDPGESMLEAGIREMKEETGLDFRPLDTPDWSRPYFTTIGMTDESCGTVFGYCSGTPSTAGLEGSEELQVVLADRDECRRILREERVAIMCAYMLMHFISSTGDPLDFLDASKA